MAKSFVLKALKIFGLEEILKITQAALMRPVSMKKAAGEELIVWNDTPEHEIQARPSPEKNGDVLPFKRATDFLKDSGPEHNASPTSSSQAPSNIDTSQFINWNRELTKDNITPLLKKEAVKEYA